MSAVLRPPEARLEPMTIDHLDAVCAVEQAAYSHPWTRANFIDSLAVGYHCRMLVGPPAVPSLPAAPAPSVFAFRTRAAPAARAAPGAAGPAGADTVIGYFIAMRGVDEVHLLNLTVAPDFQRQGWALLLLEALAGWSRGQGAQWLWLEVRASNARAMQVYERQGFRRVGLRKGYYPAHGGREDAVVMSLRLEAPASTPEGRPA